MPVSMLGKNISAGTIAFQTKDLTASFRSQKCLIVKLNFSPVRPGERYASALTNMTLSNKVHKLFGKKDLKDYVQTFINKMGNC